MGSHPNKELCGQNVSVTEMKKLFCAIRVPLRKVKLNKFLIDPVFEITLHCPNTHLNLKCGKCVNYSTILIYDTFYMK